MTGMNEKVLLVFLFIFPILIFGQTPQAFNYQAVLRNSDGHIQYNTSADFKIEILQDDSVVYSEQHANQQSGITGVVNFKVGRGQTLLGDFSQINWSNGGLQIKLYLKIQGEQEQNIGIADIVAVPFALFAQNSGDDHDWTKVDESIIRLHGNVGIGTTTPTEKLVIGDDLGNVTGAKSAVVIGNRRSEDFSKLIIGEDEDNWSSITWRNSNTATPNTLLLGTSTNGSVREVLSLNRLGRVGIGTTTPTERFVIWNDIGDVTGANAALVLGDNNSGNISKMVFGEDENHWGGLYWANSNTDKPNSFTFQMKSPNNFNNGDAVDILSIFETGDVIIGDFSIGQSTNDVTERVKISRKEFSVYNYRPNGSGGIGIQLFDQGIGLKSTVIGTQDHIDDIYGGYFEALGNTFGGSANNAIGIFAKAEAGHVSNKAGLFQGDVQVIGSLSKSGGSFVIDHPLDPENKYLIHSFVESPAMLNIYNGNIITGPDSIAIVKLPNYFEAENINFTYQLTCVAKPAYAYVLKEVEDNFFIIKTSEPQTKVSWQVTGERNDKWAQKNRIKPEVDKEKQRGLYLHPELFNQPETKSILHKNKVNINRINTSRSNIN